MELRELQPVDGEGGRQTERERKKGVSLRDGRTASNKNLNLCRMAPNKKIKFVQDGIRQNDNFMQDGIQQKI